MSDTDSHLPASAFVDPDVFQAERREIFAHDWIPVGRSDSLKAAGDYLSVGLGGWPAFVIRDEAGTLRAFRNMCRHQQLPVLENGRGHCDIMRCRYHGWTYDFTGRAVQAPPQVCPDDFETAEYRLEVLTFADAGALGFVTLDPRASPLDATTASVADAMPDVSHGHAADPVYSLVANWKIVVATLMDGPASWSQDLSPIAQNQDNAILRRDGDRIWAWLWPTLFLYRSAEVSLVQIVMPRTFTKTEVHETLHVATDLPPERAQHWQDLSDSRAEHLKAEAVAHQQEVRAAAKKDDADPLPAASIARQFTTRWSAAMQRAETT